MKISVVAWLIMVRIGRIVSPLPSAAFMSTMNTDRPSVFFRTSSRGVVRGAVRASSLYLLENRRGGGELQARPAVLLGDEAGEPARLGERAHELRGIATLAVRLAPVVHREGGAELRHRIADFPQVVLAD